MPSLVFDAEFSDRFGRQNQRNTVAARADLPRITQLAALIMDDAKATAAVYVAATYLQPDADLIQRIQTEVAERLDIPTGFKKS